MRARVGKAIKRKLNRKRHLENARRLEHDAYIISREQGKKVGNYDKTPIKYQEWAAREYIQAEDFYSAAITFQKAIHEANQANEREPGAIDQKYINRLERNIKRVEKLNVSKHKKRKLKLELNLRSIIAILGIGFGIFFLKSNITGNIVANLNSTTNNIIGAVLICIGIVSTFLYFKRK